MLRNNEIENVTFYLNKITNKIPKHTLRPSGQVCNGDLEFSAIYICAIGLAIQTNTCAPRPTPFPPRERKLLGKAALFFPL